MGVIFQVFFVERAARVTILAEALGKCYEQLEAEDSRDDRFKLLKEIEKLPKASKEVFNLFAIEGYSHQEIAERLNISEGTSKWHLSNARQILRSVLTQKENDHVVQQKIK